MLARLAYYRAASVYGYSGPKIATSVNRDNGTVHHGKSTNKVLARQLAADAVVDYLEGETVTPPELPDAMPSAYFGPGTMMPAELRARLREEERMARQRDLEKMPSRSRAPEYRRSRLDGTPAPRRRVNEVAEEAISELGHAMTRPSTPIKPCPFCGRQPKVVTRAGGLAMDRERDGLHLLHAEDTAPARINTGPVKRQSKRPPEAIKRWNTRAKETRR